MKLFTRIFTVGAALSVLAATGYAATNFVVADYNFTGSSLSSSDADATYTTAGNITAGAFSDDVGGGLLGVQNVSNNGTATPLADDRYHVGGGDTGKLPAELSNLSASLGSDDYITFTISTLAAAIDFERIDLSHGVINAVFDKRDGLQDYDWNIFVMSSATGFTLGDELGTFKFDRSLIDDLDGHTPSGLNAASGLHAEADTKADVGLYNGDLADVARSLDISTVGALQNFTGSVEFRLYFGDSSESDTRVQTVDDIQVVASVAPVAIPEPSAFILGMIGGILVLARRKR